MRPVSGDSEEWDEFAESAGAATTIDPDALSKIRRAESQSDARSASTESVTSAAPAPAENKRVPTPSPFVALSADAAAEFDDGAMTVMDSRSNDEREASAAASALGKEPCPTCGVMLAPGYPKCPRCKAVLIAAPVVKKGAGGTSLSGRTVPWTIVLIAAVLTGIIYYLAERDPKLADLDEDSASDSAQEGEKLPPANEAATDQPSDDGNAPAPH